MLSIEINQIKKRVLTLMVLSMFFSTALLAQRVDIGQIYIEDSKVYIRYSLNDEKSDRAYQLNLYSSKDNYISPLKSVSGDIGVEIYPGDDKLIIWDPFDEFGPDFDAELNLEIRGRVYVPFVKLDDFNYKSLKRGKSYELSWTGGSSSNILNIALYQGDTKVSVFQNIANVGQYSLEIPRKTKVGKNYRLRISDKNNKDDVVFSNEFAIKRKIPLAFQIAPIAAVGAGIYFLIPLLQSDQQEFEEPLGPPSLN